MSDPVVLVGVVRGHERTVVSAAAVFAERFGATLVCVTVEPSRYAVQIGPDGSVISAPLDPDLADEAVEAFDPAMEQEIAAVLAGTNVRWSVRALAGGPANELAHLAEELDAAMIVVGTRNSGFKESLREFFNGSVAAQLAHWQHRPVVVVPRNPVGPGEEPPWS